MGTKEEIHIYRPIYVRRSPLFSAVNYAIETIIEQVMSFSFTIKRDHVVTHLTVLLYALRPCTETSIIAYDTDL